MTPELQARLRAEGLEPERVAKVVRVALAEDGDVDVTSEPIFDPAQVSTADFTARGEGVVAGLLVAEAVFEILLGDRASLEPKVKDGERVGKGDVLLTVTAPTVGLLRAERIALNFLTHLSGIATQTARWVAALEGTKARVRDSRKTLPGLRGLQKWAVRCGGGVNHRMSLQDAALIKDNHVAAAGGVTAAFQAVRARYPELHIQVEVDTLDQLQEALTAGATDILLDNMTDSTMAEAVSLTAGRATLEASGGLSLDRARDAAVTGVDYLAVGGLTHSASALDIGLDFRPVAGT
ncbi:nicotinate-nucleotide pyrophosphorylase [carboxylating] [Actinocorallia herbida]|uniref:Nicotinate-nucleotide pyrophosphorylase [carboxylating] n=1 Tax=Actinocorallia herbida TaxID=58109 RepID=A0A3N1DA12_9ACTN|nr:carboxylating nicotinate-nucleotide diphosphorylase [Actinocorallia herbida]ROO90361.1 nicotinate-nucleotide pyrophosphorylase [carboxylating] [Actinocorallia herbida]